MELEVRELHDQETNYYNEVRIILAYKDGARARMLFVENLGINKIWKLVAAVGYPSGLQKELFELSKKLNHEQVAGYFLQNFEKNYLCGSTTTFLEALELLDCHEVAKAFCPSFVFTGKTIERIES